MISLDPVRSAKVLFSLDRGRNRGSEWMALSQSYPTHEQYQAAGIGGQVPTHWALCLSALGRAKAGPLESGCPSSHCSQLSPPGPAAHLRSRSNPASIWEKTSKLPSPSGCRATRLFSKSIVCKGTGQAPDQHLGYICPRPGA